MALTSMRPAWCAPAGDSDNCITECSAWVLSRSPSLLNTSMAVRICAVVGVCIIRCGCRVRICGRVRADPLALEKEARAPYEIVWPILDEPTVIQSRVYQPLSRRHFWWELQQPCAEDHPTDGHTCGRCSKCPRVGCGMFASCSCSRWQFSTSSGPADVSVTQHSRAVLSLSDKWPRTRLGMCGLEGGPSH